MRNLLIIITILLITSSKAFSLTFKKLEKYASFHSGYANGEGFYGFLDDFPNCIKLKANFTEIEYQRITTGNNLRQGLNVFYYSDGTIHSSIYGLFDCKLYQGGVSIFLDEGISESPEQYQIYFKKENLNNHIYTYVIKHKEWRYTIRAIDSSGYAPNSIGNIRAATQEEILHAEKLLKIYRNLDLSSPTSKIYSSLNEAVNQTEKKQIKKTQEPAPTKKQSESGVVAELERLQKLFNSGAITKDEYQKAKNKVLK
jgi:hypothetical protein